LEFQARLKRKTPNKYENVNTLHDLIHLKFNLIRYINNNNMTNIGICDDHRSAAEDDIDDDQL